MPKPLKSGARAFNVTRSAQPPGAACREALSRAVVHVAMLHLDRAFLGARRVPGNHGCQLVVAVNPTICSQLPTRRVRAIGHSILSKPPPGIPKSLWNIALLAAQLMKARLQAWKA